MASVVTEPRRPVVVGSAALVLVALLGVLALPPAAIAVVVLAAFALAALSPVGILAAAIVALPWFFHPVQLVSQRFAASELLLLCAIAGATLTASREILVTRERRAALAALIERGATVLRSPLVLVLLLLVVVGLAGSLAPFDVTHRDASLREWRWTLVEPLLLLMLLRWHAPTRQLRLLVAGALVAGASLAAAQALVGVLGDSGVSAGGVTRLTGPYPHPNALALFSARVALFAAAWAVLDPRARRLLMGPALLLAGVTIATFSRGALLGLAAGGVLAVQGLPRRVRMLAAGGAVAVVALMIAVGRDRMLDLFSGGSGSLRLDIWRAGLRMIGDRPLRGYGPDQFLYAYVPRYIAPAAWSERFTAHAHNLVIDFWIRLGIIGGAFAALAAIAIVRAAYRVSQRVEPANPLRSAAVVALVGAIAHGLVDNGYFTHDLAMSAWLLAWLALDSGPPAAQERTSRARPRRGWGRLHRIAPRR